MIARKKDPLKDIHKLLSFLILLSLPFFSSCSKLNMKLSTAFSTKTAIDIEDATISEGNNIVFNVRLTKVMPSPVSVSYSSVDVTAISGTHYSPASGSITFAPGETVKSIEIPTNADPAEICAPERTFKVRLDSAVGLPLGKSEGLGTIVDPDLPSLSISSAVATEGSPLDFVVSLSTACTGKAVSFRWTTSNGSALSGTDFTNINAIATIPAGSTSIHLSVPTVDDSLYESTESFSVDISQATNATLFTSSATGTVTDNESLPVAQFSSASQSISEGGGTVSFTVTLSVPSVQTITIPFTVSGTATGGGVDYTLAATSLTIPAGATSGSVSFSISEDVIVEADETIILTMGTPTNANSGTPAVHTITVANNDFAKISSVTSSNANATYTTGTISIQVNFNTSVDVVGSPLLNLNTTPARYATYVSGTGTSTLNFNYDIQNGDASADLNYVNTSSLVLAGGTIKDAINAVNADLTLPIPSLAGSLGFNKNIVINAPTIPAISSVTLPANGIYYVGDALDFSFVFSENVVVTGIPTLALNIGGTGVTASYVSGSGTSTLVFHYVVASTILGSGPVLTSPLNLSGGTIKSGTGINAVLTFTNASTAAINIDGRSLTLGLEDSNVLIDESSGIGRVFTLKLSSPALIDLTIPLTVFGTASNITDYDIASSSVVIPAGQVSTTVDFDVLDDSVSESAKNFTVYLNKPIGRSNLLLDKVYSTTVSILDDDPVKDRWSMISVSRFHSCGVTLAGVLKCWGSNEYGRLGDGTTVDRLSPVVIDSGVAYKFVSIAHSYSCAITVSDVLKCWGYDFATAANIYTPAVIDAGTPYKKIILGQSNSFCGITTTDQLKCWGSNIYGELGTGDYSPKNTPAIIDSGVSYKSISLYMYHSCGITTSNILKCWGDNSSGQLGDGTTTSRSTPLIINSGSTYKEVSVNQGHTCAIDTSDKLFCWGTNYYYQLGDGTTTSSLTSVPIDSSNNYSSISTKWDGGCAVTTSNILKCWGINWYGELGYGSRDSHSSPVVVDTGTSYKSVSLNDHACGLTSSDILKCWGDNTYGGLGNGKTSYELVPILIDPGVSYSSISSGYYHNCGISNSGVTKCWGENSGGQLGDGTKAFRFSPVQIISTINYKMISNGFDHTCAITNDNHIQCWGFNYSGQLGDGSTNESSIPVSIDPTNTYKIVSGGADHSCGITASGDLKCWGSNYNGQLGDGTTTDNFLPSITDSGVIYKSVSAGAFATCAITSTDDLKCWGYNGDGVVGDGTTMDRVLPVTIDPGVKYKQVSMGEYHACALTLSNKIKCWGNNDYGSLGDGTMISKSAPVDVDTSTDFIIVSAGSQISCGITIGGVLKCWGAEGLIGDGTMISNSLPTVIDSGVSYLSVQQKGSQSCGITSTNALKCWGSNQYGNLGNFTNPLTPRPVGSY